MKMSDILSSSIGLDKLGEIEMPGTVALKVCNLASVLKSYTDNYTKVRDNFIRNLGIKDENNSYSIKPGTEAFAKFNKEMENILEADIVLPVFKKIKDSEIGSLNVKPQILLMINDEFYDHDIK